METKLPKVRYKKLRDLTWRLFLDYDIKELPVDLFGLCDKLNIHIFTFAEAKEFIEKLNIVENTVGNDAFCFRNYIFYDDTTPITRQRFSIAHEIGHILLHINTALDTWYPDFERLNDDYITPNSERNEREIEADSFAIRLLAPLGVLQYLNVSKIKHIQDFCNIGYTAAKSRYERLVFIRKRSSKRKKEKNHGTFLLSPLERCVVENFKEFIEKNKLPSNYDKSDSDVEGSDNDTSEE